MIRSGWILVCAALLAAPLLRAQQPRDNQRPSTIGTGSITGVILADDEAGRPLRRARVMLSGSELDLARTAISGDDGRFAFNGLAPGRYSLTAAKDGYAPMGFESARPGRPPRPIIIAGNERKEAAIRMPRGAVITGMVRDPQGEPAAGLSIVLLSRQFVPATGERRLTAVRDISPVTDDRGIYRVYGLPAGSYMVAALPRFPGAFGDVVAASREDVSRALAEVQQTQASARPGMPTSRPGSAPAAEGAVALAFAPTYFPGTTLEARATVLELGPGEVRNGVDFDIDYVRTALVSGYVTVPPGMRVELSLTKADPASPHQTSARSSPSSDGRFAFGRTAPGHYAIHARAFPTDVRSGAVPAQTAMWGRTEVVVAGDDIEGITVALEPAVTLAGEVVFDSESAPAPALQGFRVSLPLGTRDTMSGRFPTARIDGAGITIEGIVPGAYRFMTAPPGIRTRVGAWWLTSLVIDGQEALDEPLVVGRTARHARVTFADRPSSLSGIVTDGSGQPAAGAFVVVFAEDPRTWFLYSRRVAAIRLNSEGRYVVNNLPEGTYRVAVSADLDTNEWYDPDVLQALSASAARITLANKETKTHNIRVR